MEDGPTQTFPSPGSWGRFVLEQLIDLTKIGFN